MWGLAAAFGPVGWVVAAVGTAATVYAATSSSDKYETSTYSDKDERESEVLNATKKEKNNKIYQDIKAYKSKQIKRIKDKYNVDIKFDDAQSNNYQGIKSIGLSPFFGLAGVSIAKNLFDSNVSLSEKISVSTNDKVDAIATLEEETEDMIKLIQELEVKIYETAS